MSGKSQKIITVRTVGEPDIELAAELFAPLILKIHKRNQAGGACAGAAARAGRGSAVSAYLSGIELPPPSLAWRKRKPSKHE